MKPRWNGKTGRRLATLAAGVGALGAIFAAIAPTSTQTAIANGDTRTLSFFHAHRKDRLTVTFRRNGRYVPGALKQLNYYLRDWRNDEQVRMDPRLFDVIWESYRMVGARQPVTVLSSYRSPKTNSMLRRRSRRVAKNSQHMHGKAMDMRFPGVNMHRVRMAALKLQRGGVGWYARSGFVHLDVGSVRAWPRLSYSQLARLFPDGKTVHVSRSGKTLPGYDQARSMIASRNGTYVPTLAQVRERGFLERLFGWGDSGDVADQRQSRRDRRRLAARAPAGATGPIANEDNSAASFFRKDIRRQYGQAPTRVATVKTKKPATSVKPAPAPVAVPDNPAAKEPERVVVPVPPRRPSEIQIAKLIEKATPDVPLPPQRPEDLVVVAENERIPNDSRGRLAALIGSNGPGAIGGNKDLPSVITQGTAVAGNISGAPDVLAFAGPIHPSYASRGRNRSRAKVVRVALRSKAPAATALARTIGTRAASRVAAKSNIASGLCAARLTTSNFSMYTASELLAKVQMHSLIEPHIVPLRVAARFGPKRLMFAQPEKVQMSFSRHSLRIQAHQRFIPLKRRQARLPDR